MPYLVFKRTIDVVVSCLALILLSPLLVPLMLALKLTGEGDIFYRQRRLGLRNKVFSILKFATMLRDSASMLGGEITLRGDPRITPLGHFLRQTKINELPQLWNVFRGEMSLVGPRPIMQISFEMYTAEVQKIVFNSKPGLTGIASLVFRDEEALVTASGVDPRQFYQTVVYPYKGQLESWYQAHKSLLTDMSILFLTPFYLFFPHSRLVFTMFPDLPNPPAVIVALHSQSDHGTPLKRRA